MLALALLAAAAAEPVLEVPAEQDIVVLSKLLDAVVFRWQGGKVDGAYAMTDCRIVRSSGDTEVDAITCKATGECLSVLPTLRKQRRGAPFDDCLGKTRKRMITELFDARALAMAEAAS